MGRKLFLYVCFMLGSLFAFSQSTGEGIKLYDREKYASSVTVLKQAMTVNPGDLNAGFWLTRSYHALGKKDMAETVVRNIQAASQQHPLLKVMEGSVALQKGDSVNAANAFAAALGDGRKKDPAIQLAIAQAHIDADKGNLYYALGLLHEATRRDGKNPAIYLAMGDAYRRLYNGSEAFRSYTSAIDLDKNNPVPYYKIGKIYQTQNSTEVFNEYYNKALALDPSFAPVYFQQYYAIYFKDAAKALAPLQRYIQLSDPDLKNTYLLADLLYINKKYSESIAEAQKIMSIEKDSTKPRIYKLLAYSYNGIRDSVNAEKLMEKYFSIAPDSTIAADDVSLMAGLLEKKGQDSLALIWHTKAFRMEKDSAKKTHLTRQLIAFNKARKQYAEQAYWYEQLNNRQVPLSNVDIFNWGVSNYNAQSYVMADSVFAIYQAKYPEQTFGYYWRARSNAAIDTAMEHGLAVPHYENLIKVAEKDTANANNRKWLIQAYGYIAAYKVNTEKQYNDALGYYDRILALDPGNGDAEKYRTLLTRIIEQQQATASEEKNKDKNKEITKEVDKDKNSPPGN